MIRLPDDEIILKICLFVSTEFTNVTDGQRDGQRHGRRLEPARRVVLAVVKADIHVTCHSHFAHQLTSRTE